MEGDVEMKRNGIKVLICLFLCSLLCGCAKGAQSGETNTGSVSLFKPAMKQVYLRSEERDYQGGDTSQSPYTAKYQYNADGTLADFLRFKPSGGPMAESEYIYDEHQNVVESRQYTGDRNLILTIVCTYDANGNRTGYTSTEAKNGKKIASGQLEYDEKGNVVSSSGYVYSSEGNYAFTFTYDDEGKRTSFWEQTPGNQYVWEYIYEDGTLIREQMRSPEGEVTSWKDYTYDERQNLISKCSRNASEEDYYKGEFYEYDTDNHLTKKTEKNESSVTSVEYTYRDGLLIRESHTYGEQLREYTEYEYDENHQIAVERKHTIDQEGSDTIAWRIEYDYIVMEVPQDQEIVPFGSFEQTLDMYDSIEGYPVSLHTGQAVPGQSSEERQAAGRQEDSAETLASTPTEAEQEEAQADSGRNVVLMKKAEHYTIYASDVSFDYWVYFHYDAETRRLTGTMEGSEELLDAMREKYDNVDSSGRIIMEELFYDERGRLLERQYYLDSIPTVEDYEYKGEDSRWVEHTSDNTLEIKYNATREYQPDGTVIETTKWYTHQQYEGKTIRYYSEGMVYLIGYEEYDENNSLICSGYPYRNERGRVLDLSVEDTAGNEVYYYHYDYDSNSVYPSLITFTAETTQSRIVQVYNENGVMVDYESYSGDTPVGHSSYDNEGRIMREQCFARDSSGEVIQWSETTYEYDRNGNEIKKTTFDEDGEITGIIETEYQKIVF